jgi:hypothetical protein
MQLKPNHMTGKLKSTMFTLMVMASTIIYGQAPTHLPQRNPEPVGFFESNENIVFFVVIPIIIAIIYVIWRVRISKHK